MLRRFFATLALATGVIISIVLAFRPEPSILSIVIIIAVIGVVAFHFSQNFESSKLKADTKEEIEAIQQLLPIVLEALIDETTQPEAESRAFVFIVNENMKQLDLVAAAPEDKITDIERQITFSIKPDEEQGFVGQIYREKRAIVADLSNNKHKSWGHAVIRLEPNQALATRNFLSIWGYPIIIQHHNNPKFIGVLAIDSPHPLSRSNFEDETFQKLAVVFTQENIQPSVVVLQKLMFPNRWFISPMRFLRNRRST